MKRMIKRLVAGVIMTTMLTTPVFAKEGDTIFNERLGIVFTEVHKDGEVYMQNQVTGELIKIPKAKMGEEAGSRTIKAIVKNGVTMVSLADLAKAMDVKLEDYDSTSYSLTATYDENRKGVCVIIWKPKSNPFKRGCEYLSHVSIDHESGYKVNPSTEIKFAPKNAKITMIEISDPAVHKHVSYGEGFIPNTSFDIEGKFSAGKLEYINNVAYVPAKDLINLINQDVTEVKYNKSNKTVTFEKKTQYSCTE